MQPTDVCVVSKDGPESLPLIVRPKDGNSSVEFIKRWVSDNKDWIDEKLLEHGAILFEGFRVEDGAQFQSVLQQYCPELSSEYRGTSPRRLIPGTEYVFSASELPPFFPIPQHLEMSFLPAPPRKIFFCCLEAPTSSGGETCLCDFKKVYDQLDPGVRSQFEEKGVLYIRNYNGQKTLLTDPTMLKGWQDIFETTDKSVVEEELRKNKSDFKWTKKNGLKIMNRESAVEPHPVTGNKIWFNHTQVFHWSMIPDELYRVYKRMGHLQYLLLSWVSWLLKWFLLAFVGGANVGFHTCFGDGSEIPEASMKHLRDVLWRNMVFNRWKKSDFVFIDNFRVSHGRQPFTGKRKIVVSWSKPCLKQSHQQKI